MTELETVFLIAVVVTAAYALARRIGLLAPIVLVLVGIVLSVVPGVHQVHLDPDLVLIGFLPPLLYVAAIETSVQAFRFHLRPILLLAVGLTLFTTFAVGVLLHAVVPALPLAATCALGAIVAPPDAVAASAVARRVGLPRTVVTILEGESLFNDATALVTLRVAVAAVTGSAVGVGTIAWHAVVSAAGGVLVGLLVAVVVAFLHRRTSDPLISNAVSLLTPFAAAFPAEAIGGSGVVAVVVAGLYIGHRWPSLLSAASRLQMTAFWSMVRFLLEGTVFLLVGLQLRTIVSSLHENVGLVVGASAAVVGAVVLARFVWMYPATYLARLFPRVRRREPIRPAVGRPTVIAWAGMRGVVTLAAAFSLPRLAHGQPFPGRDLFVWLAFVVIIVTLVGQGLTLPGLVRRLRLPPDDPSRDALAEATIQQEASRAALDRLTALADAEQFPDYVVDRLRAQSRYRSNTAWERLGTPERAPSAVYRRLRQEMIDAERRVFREARDRGRIPDEVLRRAQRDLDLEESMLSRGDD